MKDLFSVKGKVALITGGSRGIGEMIASGLLAYGARVYIAARKFDACNRTAQRLVSEFGGDCIALSANLVRGVEHSKSSQPEKINIYQELCNVNSYQALLKIRKKIANRAFALALPVNCFIKSLSESMPFIVNNVICRKVEKGEVKH